ncbi:hypothetical protein [Algoriphagus persicinus]|uniref:hypothetical protein n=1 Tax=Algoriphagus persicinus TaxID=3108754 RepID=UPI002B3AD07E|nr:hypothetical protein [Algoriphagus sp. E1-3-M2]MEB2786960.1 hypothetical protein [Algoriphagus sp. E1-3-M2]
MKATVLYSGFSAEKAKLLNNLSDIIQKIHSFQELKQGWHFGEGHEPKKETIEMAEKIVQLLHVEFFCKVDAFPGIWGEIQITAYPEDFFMEINILENGAMELVVEDKDQLELMAFEGLSLETLKGKISFFKQQILWKSFVYFPQNILTKTYPDSPVLPSGILLVQEEESRYLRKNVQESVPVTHVNILTPITEQSAMNPLFFGNSVKTNYQPMPA